MIRLLPLVLFLGAVAPALAQPAQPLTLHQVMADPDWIGPPVEQAWWSWDGRRAFYTLKRPDSIVRDTWVVPLDGGEGGERVDGPARADIDGMQAAYDRGRTRMAYVRNGDVFVRDLRNGALTQLGRGDERAASPMWGDDGALVWRVGNDRWLRWDPREDVTTAIVLRTEEDPAAPPKEDGLRELQVEMIDRFGLLPDAAKQLFAVAEMKLQATAMGIRKIDLGENGGRIVFEATPRIDPMALIQLIQKQPKLYAMDGPDKLRVTLDLPDAEARIKTARGLLIALAPAGTG